jgi:Domain of unknown function (DUF4397)
MKKLILGAIVSSLALMACTTPPPPADTSVRFVNAVSDSGGIKIFIKGVRENAGTLTAFKNAYPSLTSYKTVKEGTLTYSLCPDNAQNCPVSVSDKTVDLIGKQKKSVFLLGTNDLTDDTGTTARPLELLNLSDETAAPAADKAKIRFLHAAPLPAAQNVDVYLTKPGDPISGFPAELSYKGNNTYREVVIGATQIRVTARGVTASTLIDSGTLTLEAGKVYTALIVNDSIVLLTDN